MNSLKILGIDPGLQKTGWGVIEVFGNSLRYKAHGVIKTIPDLSLSERLFQLYQNLTKVIETYAPDEAAVEETFVNMNASSTLRLGMARGVILMVPASFNLRVGEYSANRVKKSVVGVGHADKDQVRIMVNRLLYGCQDLTFDAADALAVAICHAHYRSFTQKNIA